MVILRQITYIRREDTYLCVTAEAHVLCQLQVCQKVGWKNGGHRHTPGARMRACVYTDSADIMCTGIHRHLNTYLLTSA